MDPNALRSALTRCERHLSAALTRLSGNGYETREAQLSELEQCCWDAEVLMMSLPANDETRRFRLLVHEVRCFLNQLTPLAELPEPVLVAVVAPGSGDSGGFPSC